MMRRLGAAVVGTGFIGPVHVEAIRRLGHQVVGILGSSHEKSKAAAQKLGIENGYQSLEELLKDPAVHVVHLASPNRDHFEQCKTVLASGKHLICEKPLAMTVNETQELVKLAEKSSSVTAVNYNVRFYPMVLDAKARVERGEVGSLFHVTGSYLQDWLLYDTDFNWRVMAEQGGELRAVADIGTHWLDTICFVTGQEIDSVCADLSIVHPVRKKPIGNTETFTGSSTNSDRKSELVKIDTEDYGTILLKFKNGAKGSVTVSQVNAGRKNTIRFDLAGSQSSLAWNSEEPNQLHVGYRNRANETVSRDPGTIGIAGFSDYPGGHAEGFPDTFKMLYRAVYQEIDNRLNGHKPNSKPLYATFEDGHREVAICDAIVESHRKQAWVKVSI
jgi:predicted dehydrogenase